MSKITGLKKQILILHQAVAHDAREDEKDILSQAAFIKQALEAGGHSVEILPVTLDLKAVKSAVIAKSPDAVFNLVESIDGNDEFISMVPLLLESIGVPFTGCASKAFSMTSNKVIAKSLMRNAGIPTADWRGLDELGVEKDSHGRKVHSPKNDPFSPPYIIKHCTSHASLGITDDSVVMPGKENAGFLMADPWNYFAEKFVQGREFNISLLAGEKKVEVLPHAEIIFRNFPDDKPKIVNYAAKWDQESPEFTGTPCTFDFPESDRRLLKKLNEISMECWKIFSLSGYARVDFRVDESEIPWVLEVNANPCLSPDAGFFAACLRADMDAMTMADRIVADALDRYKGEIWAK